MKKFGITLIMAAALCLDSAAALPFRLDLDQFSINPELYTFKPDLSVSFETGTTGIGVGLESRLNKYFGVRTSFTWMPHFEVPLHFRIQVGDDDNPNYDSQGRSRFERMASELEEITGFKISQQVEMIGEPNMYNFKLLIDVHPFKDKRWYITTGFYAGSSVIGRAQNRPEDMTTLIAAAMYNNIYDNVYDTEYNDDAEPHGVILGVELSKELTDKIFDAGRMGMHVGDYKDQTDINGKPVRYKMEPGADNMVKAEMVVNSFKPYLGGGFSGQISKNDDRIRFAVDCGIIFWGGTPKIYTHDGTEIVHDLTNLNHQIEDYVKLIRPLKVFPLLNVSLTYRIFK